MKRFKRLLRSPIFWTILVLLCVVRIMAPRLILQKLNAYLADFSPVYYAHLDDLNLGILRGAYQLEGLEIALKKKDSQSKFVETELIDVSMAWRELFKGRLVTDVVVQGAQVALTKEVLDSTKNKPKEDSKKAAKKLFPVRLERLDIKNSSLEFAELLSAPEPKRWKIKDIDARVSNLTPSENASLTLATAKGKVFEKSTIRAVANIDLLSDPKRWDTDIELRNFNLPDANELLKQKLPLTITKGTLDLYSEIISENNKIQGYIKPFAHKADIVADKEHFKGFKHAAIEVTSAAANLVFRSAKEKTLATKINFSYYDSGFAVNSAEAINQAFKNGFEEKIPEGIDDEISIVETSNKGRKL